MRTAIFTIGFYVSLVTTSQSLAQVVEVQVDLDDVEVVEVVKEVPKKPKEPLRLNGTSKIPDDIAEYSQVILQDIDAIDPRILNSPNLESLTITTFSNNFITIPEAIKNAVRLKSLDITAQKLTSIAPEIGSLKNLERLEITCTWLETLPDELGKLKNLKTLSLRLYHASAINPVIFDLPALQKLQLEFPELEEFPATGWKLPSLTTLRMECKIIPHQLSQLQNLTALVIHSFRPAALPEDFHRLNKLKYLEIAGGLPQFNTKLAALEELVLQTDQLQLNTADLFQNLPQLRKAKITFNTMPVALRVDGVTALKELELRTNNGDAVRFTGTNTSVINLWIEGKSITQISGAGGLQSLTRILINNTSLTSLPSDITALKKLNDLQCTRSALARFPVEVLKMNSLSRIALYANNLTDTLPPEILKMPGLSSLVISGGNTITNLDAIKGKAKFTVE